MSEKIDKPGMITLHPIEYIKDKTHHKINGYVIEFIDGGKQYGFNGKYYNNKSEYDKVISDFKKKYRFKIWNEKIHNISKFFKKLYKKLFAKKGVVKICINENLLTKDFLCGKDVIKYDHGDYKCIELPSKNK